MLRLSTNRIIEFNATSLRAVKTKWPPTQSLYLESLLTVEIPLPDLPHSHLRHQRRNANGFVCLDSRCFLLVSLWSPNPCTTTQKIGFLLPRCFFPYRQALGFSFKSYIQLIHRLQTPKTHLTYPTCPLPDWLLLWRCSLWESRSHTFASELQILARTPELHVER